jgi:hypothetical protein
VPLLRQHAAEGEAACRPARVAMDAIREAVLFSLLTPRSLGRTRGRPVTCGRLIAAAARFDSAARSAIMVASSVDWWCSRLPTEGAEEIYANGPGRGDPALRAPALPPPRPLLGRPLRDAWPGLPRRRAGARLRRALGRGSRLPLDVVDLFEMEAIRYGGESPRHAKRNEKPSYRLATYVSTGRPSQGAPAVVPPKLPRASQDDARVSDGGTNPSWLCDCDGGQRSGGGGIRTLGGP